MIRSHKIRTNMPIAPKPQDPMCQRIITTRPQGQIRLPLPYYMIRQLLLFSCKVCGFTPRKSPQRLRWSWGTNNV